MEKFSYTYSAPENQEVLRIRDKYLPREESKLADVTGIPVVRLSSSETALAGAAKLAFSALGVDTPESLSVVKEFVPDPDTAAIYEVSYKKYEQTRKACFEN